MEREGELDLASEQLKQKARQIGAIPEQYQLIIEEYGEDRGTEGGAFFVWQNADNEEHISVELDHDGQLISLSKENVPFEKDALPEARLLEMALQFVEHHYPHAVEEFVFQEKKETEQAVQYTYAQTALDLPLPQTGFYVNIAKSGEVMKFRYDGGTHSYSIPKQIADKQQVISHYLDQIEFELAIEHIRQELYEGGDDQPHLIYETELPFISYPASSSAECEKKQVVDDDEAETLPLPLLSGAESEADIDEMIGFSPSFRKIREADLGDSIGTVWREGSDPEPGDRSIAGYFEKRNQNTLKITKDKKTGKLKGVASFIQNEGPPVWTEQACLKRALQFLYQLYPEAEKLFRMHPSENEENERTAHFQFDLQYEGVPLRLGFANISIDRTNGRVAGYLGPDIEPETLKRLNPAPAISAEEAKAVFASAFDVSLQWERDYKREINDLYKLVYRPVYPVFIDAHDGKVFMMKTI